MWDAGAIALIRAYQRHLSPLKGYRCAHRARTGRASCSEFARRAIARRGVVRGLVLLRLRLRACTASAAVLASGSGGDDGRREKARSLLSAPGVECAECCVEGAISSCSLW
jgi:putative component of membrane protein insertase Oxa1/YidC/SpoIIIJ protein YidD